jgi:N-acetyl-gamma-glutamyl-phosphate reductase
MIKAGIFGTTGYTGAELAGILARHPQVEIVFATSESFAGQMLTDVYPTAPDLPLISSEDAPLAEVDVVFLCLPHGAAAETAVTCLEAGVKVIDLSADFRLKDVTTYEKWYGVTHPAPHLLAEAVYGLTEFVRQVESRTGQARGAERDPAGTRVLEPVEDATQLGARPLEIALQLDQALEGLEDLLRA